MKIYYFAHNSKNKGNIKKHYRFDPPLFELINSNKLFLKIIFGKTFSFEILPFLQHLSLNISKYRLKHMGLFVPL